MIVKRRTVFGVREGRYIWKTSIKHSLGVLFPKVYTRLVRHPYTGNELRKLRKERGVGTPPAKLELRERERRCREEELRLECGS